jgi:hypothetical protein
MDLSTVPRGVAFAGAVAGLVAGAVTACGSPAPQPPSTALPSAGASASSPAAHAGFVGYRWTVVAIAHDGKTTQVPAAKGVYLLFTPNGEFVANEPVNTHSGTYLLTPGGFTTGQMATTLVAYGGDDPVVPLAVNAISAFNEGTRAAAKVSGDTLTVAVSGYTITAHRAARQGNFPPPQPTSTPASTSTSMPASTATSTASTAG